LLKKKKMADKSAYMSPGGYSAPSTPGGHTVGSFNFLEYKLSNSSSFLRVRPVVAAAVAVLAMLVKNTLGVALPAARLVALAATLVVARLVAATLVALLATLGAAVAAVESREPMSPATSGRSEAMPISSPNINSFLFSVCLFTVAIKSV
jgi:hypothetical protein